MNSLTENIADYKSRINKALKHGHELSTYNRDIMHAIEVIVGGFNHSSKTINLLSNELDKRIYDAPRILQAIRKFLQKENTELNILLEKDLDDHPILEVCKEYGDKVTIKRVPDEWQKRYSFNFMTIDDVAYRYEPDRDSFEAIVGVNEKETEKVALRTQLTECFQVLDRVSERYPLEAA